MFGPFKVAFYWGVALKCESGKTEFRSWQSFVLFISFPISFPSLQLECRRDSLSCIRPVLFCDE